MNKRKVSEMRTATIRQILHQRRQKIMADMETQMGLDLEPGIIRKMDTALDLGDMATLNLDAAVDYKLLELRYSAYKEIADAFRRLEGGSYGICEKCQGEIQWERLEVEPTARYCVSCQADIEELEKAEKHG